MNKKSGIIIAIVGMVSVLALGGTYVASSVLAREPSLPMRSGGVEMSTVQEDVVADLLNESGFKRHPYQNMVDAALENPGGFGGYYISGDRTTAYVYMTDVELTVTAEAIFRDIYKGMHDIESVIPVYGEYSFDELSDWYIEINSSPGDVFITTSSFSVRDNRLEFGVLEAADVARMHSLLQELGIPLRAVKIYRDAVVKLDEGDLREDWRPVVGGIEIERATWGVGLCTLGFVTQRDDVDGIVIASHCTSDDGTVGGVDDADTHQHNDPIIGEKIIAVESIDPEMDYIPNSPYNQCTYSTWDCRYSDAAWSELEGDEDIDQGEVAKPDEEQSHDVDPEGTTWDIVAESSLSLYDDIYYVGRSEGWQTAEIIDLCAASYADGQWLICNGKAEMTGDSPDPSGGDSGAPVLLPVSGDVELLGMLHSGSVATTDQFWFSKVGDIYIELGISVTWDSCVPSENC